MSHTPDAQTGDSPPPTVHVPVSGGVWPPTVGIGELFGSFAVHWNCEVSHHCAAPQSESTAQPPAGMQTLPLALHAPLRHTVGPVATVHGPSPSAKPHSLSFVSHTPAAQTSVPAAAVHVAFSVGFVCGGSFGMFCPFASLGVQTCVVSSHQLPPVRSASTSQPPAGSRTSR